MRGPFDTRDKPECRQLSAGLSVGRGIVTRLVGCRSAG